jgi:hypothetical protein
LGFTSCFIPVFCGYSPGFPLAVYKQHRKIKVLILHLMPEAYLLNPTNSIRDQAIFMPQEYTLQLTVFMLLFK